MESREELRARAEIKARRRSSLVLLLVALVTVLAALAAFAIPMLLTP